VLIALAAVWALSNKTPTYDYSQTKWSVEMDRKLDVPDDNLYRESLSLVIENTARKLSGNSN